MSIINDSSIVLHFLSGALCAASLAAVAWPLSESDRTQLWRQCRVSRGYSIFFRLAKPAPVLAALCASVLLVGGVA